MTTLLGVVLAMVLGIAAATAQEQNSGPDYDSWRDLAATAESALESNPTIQELERLRAQLAARRSRFLDAQDTNSARIQTLQGQIDALGQGPRDNGAPEAAQIADRRQALQAQLEELLAPVRAAEAAYTAADGLVAEIDRTIRERYANELLAREPTPLNPAFWSGAVSAVTDTALLVVSEVAERWSDPLDRRRAMELLPILVPLVALAVLLILRSGWWIRLAGYWIRRNLGRGLGVVDFALSLGQALLPLLGIFLIATAIRASGLGGPLVRELAYALPFVAAPILISLWLMEALFPADPDRPGPMELGPVRRDRIRSNTWALGLLVTVLLAIKAIAALTDRSDIAISVLLYPPRILFVVFLYRMGRLLTRIRSPGSFEEEGESSLTNRFRRLLGRFVSAAAVAGAILATAGYSNAADFVLIPTVLTLALTAFLILLQRLVYDLYAFLTGTPEGQSDALAPVLIGFALTLAALPIYALIWGARVTDLTEIWSRFRAGFSLGETRISPADFVTFLIVFLVGYAATRFVQGTLRNSVLPKTRIDIGGRNAIVSGLGYIGIFVAAITAITAAGINLSSLAIVAGALSVGIGFGLQNVVSNFVSGIILLIERPIGEGDWIEVNGQMGYVRDISVRSTVIETFDRTDVIVPNADLISGTVTNWTRGNLVGRVIVPVQVAIDSDTRQVERILMDVALAHPMVVLNPEPFIYFKGFAPGVMEFELRAILRDVNWVLNVQSDMNHDIVARFAREGVRMPFQQHDLWIRDSDQAPTLTVPRETPAAGGQGTARPAPGDSR